MKDRFIGLSKAFPVLVAGLAFFLVACQGRMGMPPGITPGLGPAELQAEAAAYLQQGQYAPAVDRLRRIVQDYPEFVRLPEVLYQEAWALNRLAAYPDSSVILEGWLRTYPSHALRPKVLWLLGANAEARGKPAEAFPWWLEALNVSPAEDPMAPELQAHLARLIDQAPLDDLERIAAAAAGTEFALAATYRLAALLADQQRYAEALPYVRALQQQAATDPAWLALAEDLMQRVSLGLPARPQVIGCVLPLTGAFATYGEQVLDGVLLGFQDQPSVPARGIVEILIRDTAGDPARAEAAVTELAEEAKVMAIIGPLASRAAAPAAAKAQELGLPILTLTQKADITKTGDQVFRNFPSPAREMAALGTAALDQIGFQRLAILYPDNSYGQTLRDLFAAQVVARGGTVVRAEAYRPGETDFAGPILKLTGRSPSQPDMVRRRLPAALSAEELESLSVDATSQPLVDFDAVFIPDTPQAVAMLAPQLVYYDVRNVILLGTSLWHSPDLLTAAGSHIQGAIFPAGFFAGQQAPGVQTFVDRYHALFNTEPGLLAASGYDTVRLLAHLMAAGALTRKDLQTQLLSLPGFAGVTGEVRFDSEGELVGNPVLLTVTGHSFAVWQ